MKSSSFGATDRGPSRKRNEDAFLIYEQMGLFIVCDGMGGHPGGEVASKLSAKTAYQYLRSHRDLHGAGNVVESARRIVAAFQDAHHRLRRLGETSSQYRGLGTTMTLLQIVGDQAVVGHVGDSRLYHIRSARARRITSDHTLARDLVRSGQCSETEVRGSRAENVLTRSLGQEDDLEVDVISFPLAVGDMIVMCTDGLTRCITSSEELAVYAYGKPEEISRRLVELANEDDGSDNVTVVSVRVADHLPQVTPLLPVQDASDSTIMSG